MAADKQDGARRPNAQANTLHPLKRRVQKVSKYILSKLLVPIILSALAAILVVPNALEKFRTKKLWSEANLVLEQVLRQDIHIAVRKQAVLSIGQRGEQSDLQLLSQEMMQQPELSGLISALVQEKEGKNLTHDRERMLRELGQAFQKRELKELDQRERINNLVDRSLLRLRRLRKWMKEGEVTGPEQKVIEDLGLLEKIDETVANLESLSGVYADDAARQYNFVGAVNNLHNRMSIFNGDTEAFLQKFERQPEVRDDEAIYDKMKILNDELLKNYRQLISREDITSRTEVDKYVAIIGTFKSVGIKDGISRFEDLAKDTAVAHSIRIEAIEALGVVGGAKQLSTLISTVKSPDAEIRSASVIAIGMILSGNRDFSAFEVDKYED